MKFKLFVLLAFFPSQMFSQNIAFDKGFIESKNYFDEITFEIVHRKIIIPVNINGKTYRFLLDTGAPNMISKRVFNELQLTENNSTNTIDANNSIQTLKATKIESLKIGALNFENQSALIYDFDSHNLLSCFNIDGIIGSNLFRESVLKISLIKQKLYITDNVKNLNPNTKPLKIKLIGSQKSPYIAFNFIGKNNIKASDMVLIDTGMDGYYDMSNRNFAVFSKHNIFDIIAESEGVFGIGIFGEGKPTTHRLMKVDQAVLHNTSFENLLIETTSGNNSRIGLDFLNHGDLTIDFRKKKAYFESKDRIVLEDKIPKFTPTIIENKFVIGIVWDEYLAKQISSGDEIISIDFIKLSEMPFCDILNKRDELKYRPKLTMELKNKKNEIISVLLEN